MMCRHVLVPMLLAQCVQPRNRALAAQEKHEACVAGQRSSTWDDAHFDSGFSLKWIEIIEISHVRQPRDRNHDAATACRAGRHDESVLRRKAARRWMMR